MNRLRLLLVTLFCVPLLVGGTAHAWGPFDDVCSKPGTDKSAACTDKGSGKDPITGNDGIIMKVINIIAMVAGVAAVFIIVLGGWQFIQSEGNSDRVAAARRTILYAIVGLVVLILARAILGFVLGSLK